MIKEFKKFISRGNVVDLAVGVVIGGAFSKIVSSLVDNIIMPLVGIVIGGIDFTKLSFTVFNVDVLYYVFVFYIYNQKLYLNFQRCQHQTMQYLYLKALLLNYYISNIHYL